VAKVHDVARIGQRFDVGQWRAQGFTSAADSLWWSDRACGIACVAMVLQYVGVTPVVHDLLHEARGRGSYSPRGWLHAGLVDLLQARGVAAQADAMDVADVHGLLQSALSEGPVIASVAPELPVDGRRGGHLVLVTGVSLTAEGHIVHLQDPSPWGEENTRIPLTRFAASFSGRVIRTHPAERGSLPSSGLALTGVTPAFALSADSG
jgi:Peptidase C39 family